MKSKGQPVAPTSKQLKTMNNLGHILKNLSIKSTTYTNAAERSSAPVQSRFSTLHWRIRALKASFKCLISLHFFKLRFGALVFDVYANLLISLINFLRSAPIYCLFSIAQRQAPPANPLISLDNLVSIFTTQGCKNRHQIIQ